MEKKWNLKKNLVWTNNMNKKTPTSVSHVL